MSQAKKGDTVRVHYTGKLKDGEVFDSSYQHDPVELELGTRQVIAGLEEAIEGMEPGESRSVEVPAEEAYGQREDFKTLEFYRNMLPTSVEPKVGEQMKLQTQDGRAVPAVVTRVSESTVTVDANHPLAGRDLIFDVELLEIV